MADTARPGPGRDPVGVRAARDGGSDHPPLARDDPGLVSLAGLAGLGAAGLDELRAGLSREDITGLLASFGAAAGADAASRRLRDATGGRVDLSVEAHRVAAIEWLRSWGCRHLRRADTARTAEALRAWWAAWGAQFPPDEATLTGLDEAALTFAGQAYDALRTAPAARRRARDGEVDVAFGDTATAKLMFALRPRAFPPWDEPIRLAFGKPGGGAAYVRLLRLSAAALDGLARRLGARVSDLPEILGRPGSTPPKLVDEFLWIWIRDAGHDAVTP